MALYQQHDECPECGGLPCHCGRPSERLHHVKLTGGPTQHTQWSWFVENPLGGGSGQNAGAGVSMSSAHRRAIARHTGLPPGARYRLSVNGRDCGVYIVTGDGTLTSDYHG